MPDRHTIARVNVLIETLSALARQHDAESLFRVLAERVDELIECKRFTVVLCDDNGRIMQSVLIADHAARAIPEIEIHLADIDVIRRVIATGTPATGTAGICSPMESDGRLVGVVCCAARTEPYSTEECRFADFLAEYLAGALTVQMSHMADHDVLTDLPNRRLLNDRLGRAIALAHRNGTRLAVLFLDLDRFKHVNDSLGHIVGDLVIRTVADRLAGSVRSSDTVSRHGGDEFVVMCAELERPEDAAISAAKIVAAVAAPIHIAGHEIRITCSVGISIYPEDGRSSQALIARADTAMYHAKSGGASAYRFFEATMNIRTLEQQFVEEHLRGALDQQQFVMHYQPKVNLETGTVIGAEALIRWRHPELGLVTPAHFVPVAEQCGLIVPIGRWALREACRQARTWQDAGLPPLSVSVNLSASELKSETFLEGVRLTLEETGLSARCLELELTESVLMEHAEGNIAILQALRAMGVKLAIDDFGTGYSSLSYLTRLPIDALKVDQSFVRQLVPDTRGDFKSRAALIVSAVIALGKSLGHRVVAEGVETREQLAFLRMQHCSEGQGFLFSRPLVANEFPALIEMGDASRRASSH